MPGSSSHTPATGDALPSDTQANSSRLGGSPSLAGSGWTGFCVAPPPALLRWESRAAHWHRWSHDQVAAFVEASAAVRAPTSGVADFVRSKTVGMGPAAAPLLICAQETRFSGLSVSMTAFFPTSLRSRSSVSAQSLSICETAPPSLINHFFYLYSALWRTGPCTMWLLVRIGPP